MQKYQVTIEFEMDDEFMSFVPKHRTYIDKMITRNVIEYYSVSMETQRCWMIINASDKKVVEHILQKSPLVKYWTFEIDELFVYDSIHLRLPELNLN